MDTFSLLICKWYRRNKRDLPWRNTKNPYFIWLSEIILQQTRVNQGMDYYLKFTKNYPTISDLANASEKDVLNDWQGLGYYSRARNLHFTAKKIHSEMKGVFPNSYSEILTLKGIGSYTAAAIASFSFNLPHAVLDGNVFRVISRVFDLNTPIDSTQGKKEFQELADLLLDKKNPALHNQAIMEFGALQCVPQNPVCEICPLLTMCAAFQKKTISIRPVKQGKTKVRNRFFNFLRFYTNESIYIEKRVAKDIWQNLYQFPLYELDRAQSDLEISDLLFKKYGVKPRNVSPTIKHILSHQHLYAKIWEFDSFPSAAYLGENWLKIKVKDIQDYPLPRLLDRFLEG